LFFILYFFQLKWCDAGRSSDEKGNPDSICSFYLLVNCFLASIQIHETINSNYHHEDGYLKNISSQICARRSLCSLLYRNIAFRFLYLLFSFFFFSSESCFLRADASKYRENESIWRAETAKSYHNFMEVVKACKISYGNHTSQKHWNTLWFQNHIVCTIQSYIFICFLIFQVIRNEILTASAPSIYSSIAFSQVYRYMKRSTVIMRMDMKKKMSSQICARRSLCSLLDRNIGGLRVAVAGKCRGLR
jgi:hypothetical protein